MLPEIQKTITLEGGYSNDPDDAGSETNFGISKRAYPDVDIKNLTAEDAAVIYKRDYWDKLFLDSYTFPPFRWKIMDISVNCGLATATAFLAMLTEKKDTIEAVYQLIEFQIKRYGGIVYNKPIQLKFLRGWLNRGFENGKDLT